MVYNLNVKDNNLSIRGLKTIPSTQNKSDKVKLTWDDSWEEQEKTIVFYSDTTEKRLMIPDDQGESFIPWENLVNTGYLYIGVFGIEGSSKKATNFVTLEIIQGSYTVGQGSDEQTQDIFQQILNNMNQFSQDEQARAAAETSRKAAETTRANSYSQHLIDMAAAKTAEANRVAAELVRVNQETTRQNYYNAVRVLEAYNATKAYKVNNKVTYLGGTYICIANATGQAPSYNTNNTYWNCIAAKGTDGAGGDMFENIYDPTGRKRDIFLYTDTELSKTFLKSNIVHTDTVNDTNKVGSASVLYAHGIAIGTKANASNVSNLTFPTTEIATGTDLNSFVTPTELRCMNATIAAALLNCPHITSGFKFTVENLGAAAHVLQTLKAINGGVVYYRHAHNNNGWIFGEWISIFGMEGMCTMNTAYLGSLYDNNTYDPMYSKIGKMAHINGNFAIKTVVPVSDPPIVILSGLPVAHRHRWITITRINDGTIRSAYLRVASTETRIEITDYPVGNYYIDVAYITK